MMRTMTHRSRLLAAVVLVPLLAAAGGACGTAASGPAITRVRPAAVAPGGMLLLSGTGFDPAGGVSLDGRPLERVTWVNAELLAAVIPGDTPAGAHPVEVWSPTGRRTAASILVDSPPAVERPAEAPAPPAPPAPPAIQVPASTPRTAPAPANPRGGEHEGRDEKDDDKDHKSGPPGKGRGHGR